jgi:hypothetical protein
MELPMHYTLTRNQSYDALASGKFSNIRLFHFDHNPQTSPVFVTNGSVVVAPWQSASVALTNKVLDGFSATCYYFGESLSTFMASNQEGVAALVPIGLIESAFGGTMIESWVDVNTQLSTCTNITCTSNQTEHFTEATRAACLAGSDLSTDRDGRDAVYDWQSTAKGAGANGQLYNGMVLPFVNMSVKGFTWYQGENNLGFHAGNVLDKAGYACMLPTMIANWRRMWSAAVEGTTDPNAPFGVVMVRRSSLPVSQLDGLRGGVVNRELLSSNTEGGRLDG